MALQIAIAQINATLGDLNANCQKIMTAAQRAFDQGADLLITPELAICGYPPEDLLLRHTFLDHCDKALQDLGRKLSQFKGLHVVIGHPELVNAECYNAASVWLNGECLGTYRKQALPNYGVFDEQRYFKAGHDTLVFCIKGVCLGVMICEDLWVPQVAQAYQQQGAQIIVSLNASPFHQEKFVDRLLEFRRHVSALGMALVYANAVGAQDELVFDGQSFVLDCVGDLQVVLEQFQESLYCAQFESGTRVLNPYFAAPVSSEAQVYDALKLALYDYVHKNNFKSVVLGLSGGIDSALVLAIAVDALGPDRVRTVMMPSTYTATISLSDAQAMATGLGVRYDVIPIMPMVEPFTQALATEFSGLAQDTTEENLQARARGVLLMALSNKFGSLVLTTGNKSEMTTGYCTLYGDMAGGYALLKDVSKTLVYRLSVWRNQQSSVIPERIITRAPSAELRPDQTDQDSLPSYDVLDAIMQAYVEHNASIEEMMAQGYCLTDIQRVLSLLKVNEYKRRQAAIGPRVTSRAFGRDWRYPITNRFYEEGSR